MLGEQHPDFATSLNNLAVLYYATGRYEQAEPLYQQALEIRRQVLGEQHPDFASSLNNLAGLYDSTGRYEQAEPLYQQALEIRRQVLGEQHPDFANSLNNLAVLYDATGRYEQAEPLYQQALEIRRQVLGSSTRISPAASTTWRDCTTRRAAMSKPNRCTSRPWRCFAKSWVRTIRTPRSCRPTTIGRGGPVDARSESTSTVRTRRRSAPRPTCG